MRARKPRPPVWEQGTSRAYREGRLQDPTSPVPLPRPVLFAGICVLQAAAVAALVTALVLDTTTKVDFFWVYYPGYAGFLVSNGFLRRWSRRRRPSTRRTKVLLVVSSVVLAAWITVVILNGSLWHGRGPWVAIPLAGVGLVVGLGWAVSLYRAGVSGWRWR